MNTDKGKAEEYLHSLLRKQEDNHDPISEDELIEYARLRIAEQLQKAHTLIENLMENNGNAHTPATLQQVESRLKSLVSDYKFSNDPEQKIFGRVLDKATSDMRSQWRGSLTATKQAELAHIDEQYAKFLPVQSASGKGMNNLVGDELPGSFLPKALLKELRSGEKGNRKA